MCEPFHHIGFKSFKGASILLSVAREVLIDWAYRVRRGGLVVSVAGLRPEVQEFES